MKTVFAIGDSHTFGAEILGPDEWGDENKVLAFPNKVKDLLGYDKVDNWGISGASIMYVERGLVDYLSSNPKPSLVIIGWTCLGRMEVCTGIDDAGKYEYRMCSSWNDPKWDREQKEFYKRLLPQMTSDDLLAEKYRTHIRCSALLDKLEIPHIFFDVMQNTKKEAPISGTNETNDLVDKLWSGDNPLDKKLYNFINKDNYIENTTYWEYCFEKPNVKWNGGHYNEAAHLHWSNYLVEELNKRQII